MASIGFSLTLSTYAPLGASLSLGPMCAGPIA